MDTHTQDTAVAQHLIDLHFDIWNDPASTNRLAKFSSVYALDVFVADYAEATTDYAGVNRLIEKVRTQHTGFDFTPDPVTWNHGIGRVTWGFGPKVNPNLVRGEDIFTVQDGRLASLRVFIDKR